MKPRFKVGEVFSVSLDDNKLGYFQYLENDRTMLQSAVIRAFQGTFPQTDPQSLHEFVDLDTAFHAHVFLQAGVTLGIWRKVGRIPLPDLSDVVYRASWDYSNPEVIVSKNWYIWRANEPYLEVGRLPAKYQSAEIGIVKAPQEIAARMLTGHYAGSYPGF